MTSYKSTVIEAALTKKGFQKTKVNKRIHHKKYTLFVDGRKTSVYTFISHKKMDYSRNLLSAVKKELCLDTSEELNDLISCPMSYKAYLELLREKDYIV